MAWNTIGSQGASLDWLYWPVRDGDTKLKQKLFWKWKGCSVPMNCGVWLGLPVLLRLRTKRCKVPPSLPTPPPPTPRCWAGQETKAATFLPSPPHPTPPFHDRCLRMPSPEAPPSPRGFVFLCAPDTQPPHPPPTADTTCLLLSFSFNFKIIFKKDCLSLKIEFRKKIKRHTITWFKFRLKKNQICLVF